MPAGTVGCGTIPLAGKSDRYLLEPWALGDNDGDGHMGTRGICKLFLSAKLTNITMSNNPTAPGC